MAHRCVHILFSSAKPHALSQVSQAVQQADFLLPSFLGETPFPRWVICSNQEPHLGFCQPPWPLWDPYKVSTKDCRTAKRFPSANALSNRAFFFRHSYQHPNQFEESHVLWNIVTVSVLFMSGPVLCGCACLKWTLQATENVTYRLLWLTPGFWKNKWGWSIDILWRAHQCTWLL